jgi:hypothetical protein
MYSSYGDLGFGADFSNNNTSTREKLKQLKEANWHDDFTRAVAIVFTIFNTVTNEYA